MTQKGLAPILIFIIILIIFVVAGGTYFLGKQIILKSQPDNPVVTSQTAQPIPTPIPAELNQIGSGAAQPTNTPSLQKPGSECSDNNDCDSKKCIAPDGAKIWEKATGKCSEKGVRFGCYNDIKGGIVQPGICADPGP